MSEPRYTKKEQRERMAEFERLVKDARKKWARGVAVVILSFPDYQDFDYWCDRYIDRQAKRRRACSGSA